VAGTARASSVPLTWTAPLTLNGGILTDYVVQYRVTGTSSWLTFAHPAKATTGATVTGLVRSRSYQFRVAAHTAQGNSPYTAYVSKTTPAR
jgi:titin